MGCGIYDISEELPLQIDLGTEMMEIPRKDKTNVLGTCVDDTGDASVMVEAQIKKATGVFYKDSDVFFCADVSFGKKVAHYLKHVLPVALHGCGAWICKQGTLR